MAIRRADSEAYKASLREVVKKWPHNPHDYESTPGTQDAYDEMGRTLLDRMVEVGIPESLNTSNARYGLSLAPRYMYAGAATARAAGLDMRGLKKAMMHPNSFVNYQLPTRERNPAAVQIEFETGLRTSSAYSNIDGHIKPNTSTDFMRYSISPDDGLRFVGYALVRLQARERLLDERRISEDEAYSLHPESDPVRCAAHRGSGIVALSYRSSLLICLSDPNLFQATLDQAV